MGRRRRALSSSRADIARALERRPAVRSAASGLITELRAPAKFRVELAFDPGYALLINSANLDGMGAVVEQRLAEFVAESSATVAAPAFDPTSRFDPLVDLDGLWTPALADRYLPTRDAPGEVRVPGRKTDREPARRNDEHVRGIGAGQAWNRRRPPPATTSTSP